MPLFVSLSPFLAVSFAPNLFEGPEKEKKPRGAFSETNLSLLNQSCFEFVLRGLKDSKAKGSQSRRREAWRFRYGRRRRSLKR
jgi:hypothetical protein